MDFGAVVGGKGSLPEPTVRRMVLKRKGKDLET
jgi:hypothetical protein